MQKKNKANEWYSNILNRHSFYLFNLLFLHSLYILHVPFQNSQWTNKGEIYRKWTCVNRLDRVCTTWTQWFKLLRLKFRSMIVWQRFWSIHLSSWFQQEVSPVSSMRLFVRFYMCARNIKWFRLNELIKTDALTKATGCVFKSFVKSIVVMLGSRYGWKIYRGSCQSQIFSKLNFEIFPINFMYLFIT